MPHEVLGTILAALVIMPIAVGYVLHTFWKKHSRSSWRNPTHVWTGRVYILLLMADGFIPDIPPTIWFGAPCVLVLLIYLGIVGYWEWKKKRKA
jgi:predicted Na+-dependent transporter